MIINIAYKEFSTSVTDDLGVEILSFKDENCSLKVDSIALANQFAALVKQIAAHTAAIKKL